MIVLGIDPGSNCTGYGLLSLVGKRHSYLASGFFKLSKNDFVVRLSELYNKISEVIECYKPDEVAIEKVFMCNNFNSALKLGEARGVLMVGASKYGAKIFEYEPRKIKQTVTGFGGAEKDQIQRMMKNLLNLPTMTLQADEADALAIAYCHTVWR